jgi:hypothetical protein
MGPDRALRDHYRHADMYADHVGGASGAHEGSGITSAGSSDKDMLRMHPSRMMG